MISGMVNPAMLPSSPSLLSSLPSLDLTLPTEWQGNLLPSNIKLLHKIPIKRQNKIISYVDLYASNQNLSGAGNVVTYTKELIDEYYSQKFTAPTIDDIPEELNSSSDTIASNDMILDKISNMIQKENDIKEKQHQDKMMEHKKELIEQKKETNAMLRSIVECMTDFNKNSTANINSKGTEWLDKLVVTEKSENYPPIHEVVNVTTLGVWQDEIEAQILTAPWDIKRLSIIKHPHVGDLSEATTAYRIQANTFSKILIDLLNKKDPNIVTSICSNVATNDGVKLMESIRNFLLPLDNLQILDVLTNLDGCVQQNGEIAEGYCARLENIFIRIEKMGYTDVSTLHLVYTQRGFLRGAYGEHESLECIHKKMKNDDFTLKSYESSLEFSKQMTRQFTNNDVYKDGKIISLKNHQFS